MDEKERLATLEQWKEGADKKMESLDQAVREIKDDLLKRPSWTTTMIISGLAALCGILLTAYLNIIR